MIMREKTKSLTGLVQRLYITWKTFNSNDLATYASAGAYSFLLSALPILLIVLVILLRILHTSPEVIRDLFGSSDVFSGFFDLSGFFDSVLLIKSIGLFEIIVALSIFSMARRFFTSLQQGMKAIYRKRGKKKPIKDSLIVIAGEVILIILIVIATIFITAGNAFFSSSLAVKLLSPFFLSLLNNLFRIAPLLIIFSFLFLVYFFSPQERPSALHSFLAASACIISLALVQIVFRSFVNMARYNLVYGILSNIIVLLLQVYIFFYLFLFFAQFLYVVQFFESFLLARIYLLPVYDDPLLIKQLERIMFIEPPLFYRRYAVTKKAGEIIFGIGEDSTDIYYVWTGLIALNLPNQVLEIGRGRVFGEFSSIIGGKRTATAMAVTDVVLLKVPDYIFQETIEVDGEMSKKTLQMIADYVRKKTDISLSTKL
jgi:membrane protein